VRGGHRDRRYGPQHEAPFLVIEYMTTTVKGLKCMPFETCAHTVSGLRVVRELCGANVRYADFICRLLNTHVPSEALQAAEHRLAQLSSSVAVHGHGHGPPGGSS
jgi:hypothetical protein